MNLRNSMSVLATAIVLALLASLICASIASPLAMAQPDQRSGQPVEAVWKVQSFNFVPPTLIDRVEPPIRTHDRDKMVNAIDRYLQAMTVHGDTCPSRNAFAS